MEFALFALVAGLMFVFGQSETPPTPPAKPDRVVLLPGADGRVGQITVTTSSGEQRITQAYSGVAVVPGGAMAGLSESADSMAARHADLIKARPLAPRSFLLYFTLGDEQLTPESLSTLDELKRDVAARPAPEILIIGHTDRVGSDADNDALSLRRARAIAEQLNRQGIQALRLEVTGRGERDLLVRTADGVAEPRNRRVEVSLR